MAADSVWHIAYGQWRIANGIWPIASTSEPSAICYKPSAVRDLFCQRLLLILVRHLRSSAVVPEVSSLRPLDWPWSSFSFKAMAFRSSAISDCILSISSCALCGRCCSGRCCGMWSPPSPPRKLKSRRESFAKSMPCNLLYFFGTRDG